MYSVFKNSILDSEEYLYKLGCQWSMMDELLKDKEMSKVDDPEFSQTLCTALQIALVDLLRSFDVTPSIVIGHSSGEIAAAYCVGAVSHCSAIKLAYFRGTSISRLVRSSGMQSTSMISVGLSTGQIQAHLETATRRFEKNLLTVSCINSPKNVTISGPEVQVDALKSLLDERQVFARKL